MWKKGNLKVKEDIIVKTKFVPPPKKKRRRKFSLYSGDVNVPSSFKVFIFSDQLNVAAELL